MYKLTSSTSILRTVDGANIPNDPNNTDYAAYLLWAADGNIPEPVDAPPPPTIDELRAALITAVQAQLDSGAQALGYDDIKTAVTYADEASVPRFQQEGKALRAWRSLCWAHCYSVLTAVMSGDRGIPVATQLVQELPILQLA